jgi:predicted metal-binding protein
MTKPCRPHLIVCMTCRAGHTLADGETPQGALLHAQLSELLAQTPDDPPVELLTTTCMANCEHGCSGAITMPGKWTYVLGHLSPGLAADLLIYAAAYAAAPTGTVMPSRRPASLGKVVIARVPHLDFAA